jgi:peptide/nickel transport system substrate-binding protein
MRIPVPLRTGLWSLVGVMATLAVACGTAAEPTTAPTSTPSSTNPTPTPSAAATATPMPSDVVSARDSITLVVDAEPITMNVLGTTGGITAAVNKDNLVDPLTWQSGDDLRIVPTTATTGWEQLGPTQWRFHLRQGVKFHNGEPWNAQAIIPTLEFQGVSHTENNSFAYTGGIRGEVVDDYTLDIHCDSACPVLPNTTFFVAPVAPQWFTTASEEEKARTVHGLGPYKLVRWDSGVTVIQEAYEDYVAAGDHFEFRRPLINRVTWVWRGEQTVAAAMVQTGEADMAWDVGVDQINALPEGWIRSGGSAEIFVLRPNSLWHPELKKLQVRQAIVHAIDCEELVEFLYGGHTVCRGNIVWPGVIGATEENSAPYEYNPALARQLLEEANYNSDNVITIMGRGTRIPKQVEVYEAVHHYLTSVGMNVNISVVEPSIWRDRRGCGIGKAVNEVLEASGRTPGTDRPTFEDFHAALAKESANCPQGDLMDDAPSNETLDFGRQVNRYMTCVDVRSTFCDPSPGGIEELIPQALAASGEERQQLLQRAVDVHREQVVHVPLFEMPVFYATNPKLNFQPRFDRRVRVNSMWFSP